MLQVFSLLPSMGILCLLLLLFFVFVVVVADGLVPFGSGGGGGKASCDEGSVVGLKVGGGRREDGRGG